jgi:transglycosylase-like protein with SLT domain
MEEYPGTILRQDVPDDLLDAIRHVESGGDPRAVGPPTRFGRALGPYQFLPSTARQYGIDPFDEPQAREGARRYLSDLHAQFGNWPEAIAAYNWGPSNVGKKGLDRAPKETRNYLKKITDFLIPEARASEDQYPGTPLSATPAEYPGKILEPAKESSIPEYPGTPISQSNPVLRPLTRIPEIYREKVKSSLNRMQDPGILPKISGGLEYLFSPIDAPLQALVGEPVQQATGSRLAGEAAQTVAGLALPSAISKVGKGVQELQAARTPELAAPAAAEIPKQRVLPGRGPVAEMKAGLIPKITPEFAGNINLAHVKTSDEIHTLLKDAAKQIPQDVIPNEQTIQEAAQFAGTTAKRLAERGARGAFNASELIASRDLLMQSSQDVVSLAKAARSGADTDLLAFKQAFDKHVEIQRQVSGATAEAGRALQSFNINVPTGVDPKALRTVIDTFGGRDKLDELAGAISDLDDPAKASAMIHSLAQPSMTDKILEAWINGILSGPRTHMANITGNAVSALLSPVEEAGAALISRVSGGEKIPFRSASSQLYGMMAGLDDGIRAMGKSLREEIPQATKLEQFRQPAIGGTVGKIIRTPGRLLQAEDSFFSAVNFRGSLQKQAMDQSLKEGLIGSPLRARIGELVDAPTADMLERANKDAQLATFTNPSQLASWITQGTRQFPILKFIVPFVRTPVNLYKASLLRSPLAPAFQDFRTAWSAGGPDRARALSRMGIGTGLMAYLYGLAEQGIVTGSGPTDREQQQALRNSGWQPFSFKSGDRYISYQRIEPIGTLLGIAADLPEIQKTAEEKESGALTSLLFASISKNLTNKTFVSGITSLVDAINDPDRAAKNYLEREAGSFVPNVLNQIGQSTDDTSRIAEGVVDTIKSRMPGLRLDLPVRLDVWGEPIPQQQFLGPDVLSPIGVSQETQDPVRLAMAKDRIEIPMPRRKVKLLGDKEEELPIEMYNRYIEFTGRMAHRLLEPVVSSPRWNTMDTETKQTLVRNVVDQTRKLGRGYLQVLSLQKR